MNWGNKLLVTFIVFGAGMSYLVYRSVTTNFELVDKDYYKNELRFQEVIDGTNRANSLSAAVSLEQSGGKILLQLPAEMKDQIISGTLHFYCAYDGNKDKKFSLNTDANGMQVLDAGQITAGTYTFKINWKANSKDYYSEKLITIP